MSSKISLKTLKHVLELVERYKLDSIKFNGIEVSKSKHVVLMPQASHKPIETSPNSHSPRPKTVDDLDREAAALVGLDLDQLRASGRSI